MLPHQHPLKLPHQHPHLPSQQSLPNRIQATDSPPGHPANGSSHGQISAGPTASSDPHFHPFKLAHLFPHKRPSAIPSLSCISSSEVWVYGNGGARSIQDPRHPNQLRRLLPLQHRCADRRSPEDSLPLGQVHQEACPLETQARRCIVLIPGHQRRARQVVRWVDKDLIAEIVSLLHFF